jgi:outer membrane protein TolC
MRAIRTVLLLSIFMVCALGHTWAEIPQMQRMDRALTRKQAVDMGVRRNLGLLINRHEKKRQELGIASAKRAYIPQLTFDGGYANRTPFNRSLSRDQRLSYGAVFSWASPIGTSVNAGIDLDQNVSGATKESEAVNTAQHASSAFLSARQPLLKGGWSAGAATPLEKAKLDALIQQETYRQELNALIVDLERAYSDLAYAQADLTIKTRSRDRAKKQFEDTKENIRRGIIADIEIYVVEENLVYFEQQLVQAAKNLALARRSLAQLLHLDEGSHLKASEGLKHTRQGWLKDKDAVRLGLDGNPSLRIQQLQLARSRVQVAFEKNQVLPELDLVTSLKLNGLDASYAEHWNEMIGARRPEVIVGLSLTLPLSIHTNRAEKHRAELQQQKELVRLKQREVHVRYLIGDLLTRGAAEQKRLALATRRVELNRLKLKAELEKYKNGISTLADVVRFQRDLDQALISEQQAFLQLNNTRSQLHQAQGRLHRFFGIQLKKGA